ncbi:MAG: GW dipeptide domain-containing protein [Ignavibacteria bacterium]|nr:GW dipeptide domain-containing protein [Ignavibacteria bacterium]
MFLRNLLIVFSVSVLLFAGCKKEEKNIQPLPEGYHAAKVLEHMNASNYTYLRVEENDKEYWMAVPQLPVEVDEMVYYSKSMEMKNFHSETLKKDFPSILFVQDISKTIAPANQNAMGNNPHVKGITLQKEEISIEPAAGGKTVAQILEQKETLNGKPVTVKGKVTKFNGGILDKNWIHIQDGTNANGEFDLLVTSKDIAQVGDIIIVKGKVALNKDFGAGYSYKILIEDASISVSK